MSRVPSNYFDRDSSYGRDGVFQFLQYRCNKCGACFSGNDDFQVHKLTEHYKDTTKLLPPYGMFLFEIEHVNFQACVAETRLGPFRGIQGENNSCYLDASLMAMFYANDSFDDILRIPGSDSEMNEVEYTRIYMTLHIVNNLRRRGFVPSMLVLEWRRMISAWFGASVDFDNHCEEEEACEFIRFLLERFGNDTLRFAVEPVASVPAGKADKSGKRAVSVASGSHSPGIDTHRQVMMQLLSPSHPKQDATAWSIQELLEETLLSENLVFTELGSSLILQLPRYGKRERAIGDVVPDPFIYAYPYGDQRSKVRYELRALVVIGIGHFVSYLRVPKSDQISVSVARGRSENEDSDSDCAWLYFDSMSDRSAQENIPLIANVSEDLAILETLNAASVVGAIMGQHEPGGHLRRVVQDMSMALYSLSEYLHLKGEENLA